MAQTLISAYLTTICMEQAKILITHLSFYMKNSMVSEKYLKMYPHFPKHNNQHLRFLFLEGLKFIS